MYLASTAELLADIAQEMELEPTEASVVVEGLVDPPDDGEWEEFVALHLANERDEPLADA